MSIVRCPYCGKATVAVRGRAPKSTCTRCGRSLKNAAKLARSDGGSLTEKVREHLHRQQGLSRPR
jgi:ribosomal protein L37AE/L43A